MRRLVYGLIATAFALCLLVLVGIYSLPSIASYAISKRAKVTTHIESIHFDSNNITINKFWMKNPDGFTTKRAVSINSLSSEAPLTNYIKNPLLIPSIVVKDIHFTLVEKGNNPAANWAKIISNLDKNAGQSTGSKEVIIRSLTLYNIKVDMIRMSPYRIKHLKPIRKMHFSNVSSKTGIPQAQIINLILKESLKEIFSLENIQGVLEDLLSPGENKSPLDVFKNLFG